MTSAYRIGDLVRFKDFPHKVYTVRWVGSLPVRNVYGVWLREAVYLLGTGTLDCYFEEDLEPAFGSFGSG